MVEAIKPNNNKNVGRGVNFEPITIQTSWVVTSFRVIVNCTFITFVQYFKLVMFLPKSHSCEENGLIFLATVAWPKLVYHDSYLVCSLSNCFQIGPLKLTWLWLMTTNTLNYAKNGSPSQTFVNIKNKKVIFRVEGQSIKTWCLCWHIFYFILCDCLWLDIFCLLLFEKENYRLL